MATRERVLIYLYDLSQGMAKAMSQQFLGKQIDGIWHTGIIAYGYEYYYGGGIQAGVPGETAAGQPVQVIDMGETTLSQLAFHDFLRGISSRFTPETYSLLKNNCNNFSDEASKFLVNKPIPSFITGLPEDALSTPMGMMFRPMIENMEKGMRGGMAGVVPWGSSSLSLPLIRTPGDRRPPYLPPTMTAPSVAATSGTPAAATGEVKAAPATAPVANADGVVHLSPSATASLSIDTKHKSYETLIKINNKKVDASLQLSAADIEQLGYVVTILTATTRSPITAPAYALFDRMLQWPIGQLFPVLGLFRLFVLHGDGLNMYATKAKASSSFIDQIISVLPADEKKSDVPAAAQMMALGTLSNFFSNRAFATLLTSNPAVVNRLSASLRIEDKSVRIFVAGTVFNWALTMPKDDSDLVIELAGQLVAAAMKETEAEICGRILLALGQLIYSNSSLLLLIPALEFNPSGIVARFPSGAGNAHHDKVQGVLKDIAVLIVQQQKLSA